MAVNSKSPFAIAIESFIADIKRNEDIRSPFYREVITQAVSERAGDNQSLRCAEQLSTFIADLERKQKRNSKTLWVTEKLRPLLAGLNEYVQACDVMIQAAPSAAVLLYGGARLVLHLGQNFYNCFDTVLGIMEEIGNLLKCYDLFAKAYKSSADLQSLLVESYKNIITFWQKASKLLSRKPYKTLLTNIVKPLYAEWQKCRDGLQRDRDRIQILAQATEADIRRQRDQERVEQKRKIMKEEIVKWIKACEDDSMLDTRTDVRTNMEIHHGHSCEWLFRHPDFRTWIEANKTTSVWYNAPPGAGKTILTSAVVRHLQDEGHKTAAFFYSFNNPVKKKSMTALRCLALQLLSQSTSIPTKVAQLFEDDVEHHCFKLNDPRVAVEVIEALVKQLSRIHIFIDGLDECEDREQLFICFGRLLNAKTYGIVKWFFSSRPDRDIRTHMQKHNVKTIEAPMDSLISDVESYLRDQMDERLDHYCEKCIKYWTDASEGNFLWITLMLRIMEGEGLTCEEEIEEELNKFPKGLTGCYLRSLAQIARRPEKHQQLAQRIFTMIVGSAQPLRLSELAHALAASASGPDDFSAKRVPKLDLIEELCSNLIIFDRTSKGSEADPLLKIAHKSILDFFLQDPGVLDVPENLHQYFISSDIACLELGRSSLNYLKYARYHQKQDISNLLDLPDHAFLKHAATFSYWYLSYAKPSAKLFEDILDFVKSPAFWSCIAVQSKVAPHLFARYEQSDHGCYTLEATGPTKKESEDRVNYAVPLPMWLDDYKPGGARVVQAFLDFVKEWHIVLNTYPLALDQCIMDAEWNEVMPGRDEWLSKRAERYALCPPEAATQNFEQLAIKDLQVNGSNPDALAVVLFGLQRTARAGIIPQWLHLQINSEGVAPSVGSRPRAPIPIADAKGYELFNPKFEWGLPCSALDPASLRVYELQFDGNNPTGFAPETSGRYLSNLEKHDWRILSRHPSELCDNKSRDQCAIAFHCIAQYLDSTDNHVPSDSGFGSATSSDQEFDQDDDSGSDCSSVSGVEQEAHHCMLFLHGGAPVYAFWKGHSENSEVVCAFHPVEPLAVWSHTAQELCVTNMASGRTDLAVLPEPADIKLSSAATVRREFHFSASGEDLSYLLYMTTETETGMQQTVSVSSFRFSIDERDGCLLQRNHPTATITHECSNSIQNPLILSFWNSEYIYVALPPLSCNAKIVRLRLPHGIYSEESASDSFETLRDPIFFPYSTQYRNAGLKVLGEERGQDVLALTLDADIASERGTDQPTMRQAPSLVTWSIAGRDGWRAWHPQADSQSEELKAGKDRCKMLRGTFVDADKRFNVPIRSGLDWTKKAFLSCS
ncbi:MAG: hypothetical protein M1821_001883 [Bathelium mastoideum]|nr:MAG: hypothetical protein M1821_001883 [Bathelium mastoideum]